MAHLKLARTKTIYQNFYKNNTSSCSNQFLQNNAWYQYANQAFVSCKTKKKEKKKKKEKEEDEKQLKEKEEDKEE